MSEHVFVFIPPEPRAYAYLLGVFLGDGHVMRHGRTARLVVTLDAAYPGIVAEVLSAAQSVIPSARVVARRRAADASNDVVSYALAWLEAFPQHGPGRKHERPIVLEGWQQAIVDAEPEAFLRGLIHSDGCRCINRFRTRLPGGRLAEYEYPRYFFSNLSAEIRELFCAACERLGIRWTQSNHRNVSVSHRASVAKLDAFVGPKA